MSARESSDRRGFTDVVVQLGRRWFVVLGGAVAGLVVATVLVDILPGLRSASYSERLAVVGVLVLLGVAGGFFFAIALLSLRPVVTTVDDVRRVTGLPVVAQVPSLRLDGDDFELQTEDARGAAHRLQAALREAVLNTRALNGGSVPRRLVVARTDTVAESAGVDGGLARALVDSGLVTGILHSDFDSRMVSRPSTLEDLPYARGQWSDGAGYQHLPVPTGVSSSSRADRLAAVDLHLDGLGDRYDVVVAQASTASLPLDLRSIAPVADAVLLVVASNRTSEEALLALQAELLSLDVAPLGVVMTAVAPRHFRLLRNTWAVSDFRAQKKTAVRPTAPSSPVAPSVSPAASEEQAAPRRSGFSIADLARMAEANGAQTDES
ncbi:hypothetical protein [Frondihabitans cladoniiphilus]|uniref:Capsular polysaccharide biosynthesis protein n=1 Tax=Frondihabitans cladoniiphilus TaxID=715785 RepID=A0ABP8W8Y0_9MICO